MTRAPFGTTAQGEAVERVTLDNGALRVAVLTYGATLNDLRLAGLERPLTMGGPRIADYEPGGDFLYAGAVVGPIANRIRDGRTTLDGTALQLDTNAAGGHMLHGGDSGLHQKIWPVESLDEDRLVLATTSADGEGGLPGARRFTAHYQLDGTTLSLRLRAETDRPTLINLANHSYWCLGPDDTFHDHRLQVAAAHVLPVDAASMATGAVAPVDGTEFDFRASRTLGSDDHFDHNLCLSETRRPIQQVARLASPDGVQMTLETTEPGLQIYDARHLPLPGALGHDGRRFGPRAAIALEAQFWPDAPNNPAFPSIRLDPGGFWEQHTRFRFSRM